MKIPMPRTVRQKLLGVVLLTTLVALVVALGATVGYNLHLYRSALIADMSTQAELLGNMTAPALSFNDKQLAMQNLGLLRLRPTVRAAAIYDANGRLFAEYRAGGEKQPLPGFPGADAVRVDDGKLILFDSIVNDGKTLGTVYLRANYEFVGTVLDYVGIAAIVTVVAMLVAFLLSIRLQRIVTAPILAIADISREVVSQSDYSRRANKMSDDEVGILVDSFNRMLSEIERRTGELETSNREIVHEVGERVRAQQEIMQLNEQLESRVRNRTAQLEAANEELAAASAVAEEASRAKSAFLSSMSHELRTPLNAILGFTQLLASESMRSTPEQRKDFIDHILKAGRHLLVLINEVLDLAKVESGTMTLSLEPVGLADVLQECREMMAPMAAERHVRIVFPEADLLHIVADRTRLKQVLLNLLSNAIKYNHADGSVTVACAAVGAERVRITVQDSGIGMRPEQLEQLFQPFNRLGQEAGAEDGTGIGLVVTRRLVELMGGDIGVTSSVDAGSTFWVELKSADVTRYELGIDLPSKGDEAKPARADVPQQTLLYVEDNPANLKLVQVIIAFRGDLRLLSAADANLGIELARLHQPDVILMDINLPGMSGNEALKKLRADALTVHIPVIALTANAMSRDAAKGMALGFFRYLTKPININEFLETMDSALECAKRRAQDQEN